MTNSATLTVILSVSVSNNVTDRYWSYYNIMMTTYLFLIVYTKKVIDSYCEL